MKVLYTFLFVLSLVISAFAGDVKEYAVQVSVQVQENPPKLIFNWTVDNTAEQYYVFKKTKEETSWGDPIAILSGSATQFTDEDIEIGEAFEYGFYKNLHLQFETVVISDQTSVSFKINDSWHDGVCCNHGIGYYKVYGKEKLYVEGGEFGETETKSFIVDAGENVDYDTVVVEIQLDIFGEETTWELKNSYDNTVMATGGPYEAPRFGHIFAGIKYPFVEFRGTVLLVIDNTYINQLEESLNRYEQDLICDGWKVKRIGVSRNETVTSVKRKIFSEYENDTSIKTVFLFGHVPVPYSGNIMSAHTNHQGAYPADVYYAEFDDIWTDESVRNTTASREENWNIPGDGKFDNTFIESGVDLQIGRVDMYDLPAFSQNEVELLEYYLTKNHDFRYGTIEANRMAVIDDNVGELGGMATAAIGLRNFSAMFGAANVSMDDYFTTLGNNSYLWSQGCGGSSYTSCGGVGSTNDFATKVVRSVFTMLYGSYFGDWDNTNNILRSPLASVNSILVNFWAGAPTWHLHHMALGETIGYSTKISQNNINLYAPADRVRQVHIALMGDPTLRMHIVKPPINLSVNAQDYNFKLNWNTSSDDILGYHIYRADTLYGTFERLTEEFITEISFIDTAPLKGENVYMVRALKLETTGSGTYYNLSQGIIAYSGTGTTHTGELKKDKTLMQLYSNPVTMFAKINYSVPQKSRVNISICDLTGRVVKILVDNEKERGDYSVDYNKFDLGGNSKQGVYLCYLRLNGEVVATEKIFVE